LHQPRPSHFERTLDAYRALEALLAGGQVRAIGVSNFMPEYLETGVRGGPDPDTITLETYGMPIPEA